jgi:uncharacterized protein (UPF0248 family)
MLMSTIRDLLNKIKWTSDKGLEDCEIVIVHRGAPGDLKVIKGIYVKDVAPRAIICEEDEEELIIPYHRIMTIRRGHEVLWEKRKRGG